MCKFPLIPTDVSAFYGPSKMIVYENTCLSLKNISGLQIELAVKPFTLMESDVN